MKVSIIVPCYNQAQYLDQALQSVLEQTYQDWECIIVNDGSTDHTEAQAKIWIEKDDRFSYYFKPNGGLPSARNFGIEKAIGTYILPLDADDYLSNDYIGACVTELSQKGAKLAYGKVMRFGEETGEWKFKPYTYETLLTGNIIHCSAMFRKQDWEIIGGYDERLTAGLEDWEFWVHLLDKKDKVVKLDTISFFYRIRKNSMIKSMDLQQDLKVKEYVFNKHAPKYFMVFQHYINQNKKQIQNLDSLSFLLKRAIVLIARKTGLK